MFTKEEILTAIEKAAKGHMRKTEVRRMLADKDRYAATILADIADGSYHQKIEYRQLERTGNNGKRRKILSPSLYTRVLQIAWMILPYPSHRSMGAGIWPHSHAANRGSANREPVRLHLPGKYQSNQIH